MIQLLDCTLRDGGYINDWQFGNKQTNYLIKKLNEAKVDYIEAGFLNEIVYQIGSTNFSSTEQVEEMLSGIESPSPLLLMVRPDRYHYDKLLPAKGKIRFLRIAFYRKDLQSALEFARNAICKGYKVFFNLVNSDGYSKEQLRETVVQLVDLNPYAITIVDTFGCMTRQKLSECIEVLNDVLPSSIKIAFHPHNNMLMGFCLAQDFIRIMESFGRDGILDGTLLGMGRQPGNLPSELIAVHLNSIYEDRYDISELAVAIERVINPIQRTNAWGYSFAYMLGASERINRNYTEFYLTKKLPLAVVYEAVKSVPKQHAEQFDVNVANNTLNLVLDNWKKKHCALKLIYDYSVDQCFNGMNIYSFRYEAGKGIASCIPPGIIDEIDYVVPVPNTGNAYADGFAAECNKECIQLLKKKDCGYRTLCIESLVERKNAIMEQISIDTTQSSAAGKNIALIDEAMFSGITLKTVCEILRKESVGKIFVFIPIGICCNKCNFNELPNHDILSEQIQYNDVARYIGADEVFIQDQSKMITLMEAVDYEMCYKCFINGEQ